MAGSKVLSQCFEPAEGVLENKNPIIFLHAMLCSKEIWGEIPYIVADATRRKVYTYDARNHGDGPVTEESDFKFNVDDLFNLMDDIKAKKVILVGHDMGGMTAISAALQHPDKFEKVVVVEMYAKKVPSDLINRTKIFMTTWAECVQEVPKKRSPIEDIYVTKESVENLYKNKLQADMQEDNEKKSLLNGTFKFLRTDKGYNVTYHKENLSKALDKLTEQKEDYEGKYDGPAYFFYGTESHYKIADEKAAIEKHFPKVEMIPFKKASHFFIIDIPKEFSAKLIEKINAV